MPGGGCGWARVDSEYRCSLPGVKEACEKSCCHVDPDEIGCGLDDWDFNVDGYRWKTCGWVRNLPEVRCMEPGARDACLQSCCRI